MSVGDVESASSEEDSAWELVSERLGEELSARPPPHAPVDSWRELMGLWKLRSDNEAIATCSACMHLLL